jgi:hypothetical protein
LHYLDQLNLPYNWKNEIKNYIKFNPVVREMFTILFYEYHNTTYIS